MKGFLVFENAPKNCGECVLFNATAHYDEEACFGDNIVRKCPFGVDLYGCYIERPKDCPIQTGGNIIEYHFRVDYYSVRNGCYTYKMVSVKADSEEEAARKAIKKSRIKDIEDITLVSYTVRNDDTKYV